MQKVLYKQCITGALFTFFWNKRYLCISSGLIFHFLPISQLCAVTCEWNFNELTSWCPPLSHITGAGIKVNLKYVQSYLMFSKSVEGLLLILSVVLNRSISKKKKNPFYCDKVFIYAYVRFVFSDSRNRYFVKLCGNVFFSLLHVYSAWIAI